MWYWLVVWNAEGEYWIVNRYASHFSAEKQADKMDVVGYEIEKLPTMNEARATQMIKGILVERDPQQFKSLRKFRHAKKSAT